MDSTDENHITKETRILYSLTTVIPCRPQLGHRDHHTVCVLILCTAIVV